MWFPLGFQNFIVKKSLRDDLCDIHVSNFINIWHISLSNNELVSISKTLNPLLEASVHKLREIVFRLLEDKKVKKEIIEKNKNILLKIESNIMEVRFQFQVLLSPGNEEMLYNELTLPLLLLLIKTQNREKKLINIIKNKDAEIESYKQEYGARADFLATEPFSENEFDSRESATDTFWDPSILLDCISTKTLSNETVPAVKQQKQLLNDTHSVDKSAVKRSVIQDKNTNRNEAFLILNNKTIKKRKNINEEFKIKF